MCNYVRKRFPCGATTHLRFEWQSCAIFKDGTSHVPCFRDKPPATTTYVPATAADSSYRCPEDSDPDAEIPILCHSALCRECRGETEYQRALSRQIRENKYGPDEDADWYGHGDPDVDPNFPEYQAWLKKQEMIDFRERVEEAADEDRFWILDPSETWRGGECGRKTKDGEPIEKVDRKFQWAAKCRLREIAFEKKFQEREERNRVAKEEQMQEKKRAEELGAMEGVEKTEDHDYYAWEKMLEEREERLLFALKKHMEEKQRRQEKKWFGEMDEMEGVEESESDWMCLDGAYEQEPGGKSGEREEHNWEKAMGMSIDSLVSLSL